MKKALKATKGKRKQATTKGATWDTKPQYRVGRPKSADQCTGKQGCDYITCLYAGASRSTCGSCGRCTGCGQRG